jgi:DNA-binding CsgD family transcriptional regulator
VRLAAGEPTVVLPMPPEIPIVRHYVTRTAAWLQAVPDIGRVEADLKTLTARARPRVDLGPDRTQLPPGPIRELPTRSARGVVLNTLMMSARTELYGLQCGHNAVMEDGEGTAATNVEICAVDVLARGVRVRTVYDHAVLDDGAFLTATLDEVAAGAEARVLPELATDFIVADNACALVTTSFAPASAFYTESPEVIWMLRLLFESLWERAQPIGHRRWDEATTTLTDGHRLVLALLVNGLNNEAIARTLRLNPRTVRRRIDDLSVAYGVTNRNALIAAAVRQADQ